MTSWLSTAPARLAIFAAALVVAFGAAYTVGSRFPKLADASSGSTGSTAHAGHGATTTVDESQPHTHDTTPRPASPSADGYELRLDGASADAHTLTYRIVGPGGTTVTAFEDDHGALLHAVVVHPDLSGFRHVHPQIAADGTWTVTVPSGPWHLVFDVWPAGAASNVVLSTNADDEVPVPTAPLPAADDAPTVDGLVVRRDGLTFTVTNTDGTPATGLEPYLGMPAHLIVLRQGDLAYTHLHAAAPAATGSTMAGMPDMTVAASPSPANVFSFGGSLPAGTSRAWLQFGHDGDVVTVPFTVVG
ncbi:MAG: hypothetical protein QM733_05910 [Ilumatobacteraceae bacterium]